jgi:hypothetical protein
MTSADDDRWWEAHQVRLPTAQNGRWSIEHFSVGPEGHVTDHGIEWPRGHYTRLVRYSDEVPEVDETMGIYVRPGGNMVMSDTPDEIEDHRPAMEEIRKRGGRVLIHGLGLGMITRFALEQPNVEHVDVVELDQEVIDLVSPHYRDQRLTIHQGDARTYPWPPDARWTVVWHDIWGDFKTENLKEMEAFHQRFEDRCEWQGSWSRNHLLAKQEREQSR